MRKARRYLLPFYLLLGACMPVGQGDTPTRAASSVESEASLPPMKSFSVPRPQPPVASNSDMARDFLDLAFTLESGRQLPVFTRFEGPITVRVTGEAPVSLTPDLKRLLHRLRTEAGIQIDLTGGANANITVQAVTRSEIRDTLPSAACFVVPNVSSLAEYRSARRTKKVSWSQLRTRERLAIFLPNDSSPQEVRDCLHEELAQAIGPLNDLYRLPDSVFNDDNVHTVLTGHDMTILRAYYDPGLRNGMTRNEVADRLPAILARINPRGVNVTPQRLSKTPRIWIDAVQTALGPGANPAQRRDRSAEGRLGAWLDGPSPRVFALRHGTAVAGHRSAGRTGPFRSGATVLRQIPGHRAAPGLCRLATGRLCDLGRSRQGCAGPADPASGHCRAA